MELRNLITFLKIVETGSFSKAAEQLRYSQSTVTVQIQQLEEELNVQLFDRIGKKIYVTEKGRELETHAQKMIDLSQKIASIGGEELELQVRSLMWLQECGMLCGRVVIADGGLDEVGRAVVVRLSVRYPGLTLCNAGELPQWLNKK